MIESIILTVLATSFLGVDIGTGQDVYIDFIELDVKENSLQLGYNEFCHKGTCADSFFIGTTADTLPDIIRFHYLYFR